MSKFYACIIFLTACTLFISCSVHKHAAQSPVASGSSTYGLKKKQRTHLVSFAYKQLNTPYKWGGNTPQGFDCSGFTCYCFGHFGIPLARTAADQSESGKKIRSKKAKQGDLIFFKGPDQKQKKVAHVGIIVSGRRQNIQFIHAGSKGVTISRLKEDYFNKRFKIIRRIHRSGDKD